MHLGRRKMAGETFRAVVRRQVHLDPVGRRQPKHVVDELRVVAHVREGGHPVRVPQLRDPRLQALGGGGLDGARDEAALRSLTLSAGGRAAVEVLLEDLRCLREQGLEPLLDCITAYPRDDDPDVGPTGRLSVGVWHSEAIVTSTAASISPKVRVT